MWVLRVLNSNVELWVDQNHYFTTMTSMQYADGTITSEDEFENVHTWTSDWSGYSIRTEYPPVQIYVVTLDDGTTVNVLRNLKSMEHAKVGDRIRVGSNTRDFGKGSHEYYNLSRGPPPMRPLKKYADGVHKGGDGCDYTIEYKINPSGKGGTYYWKKIQDI